MTQIDGLVYSKATVCSKKTDNFGDQNRRFAPFISQKRKTAIGTLPSRHRNKGLAKGLKVAIFACKDFRAFLTFLLQNDTTVSHHYYDTITTSCRFVFKKTEKLTTKAADFSFFA